GIAHTGGHAYSRTRQPEPEGIWTMHTRRSVKKRAGRRVSGEFHADEVGNAGNRWTHGHKWLPLYARFARVRVRVRRIVEPRTRPLPLGVPRALPVLLRYRFIRSLDRSRRPRRQRHRMVLDLLHYLLHSALELGVVPRDHRLRLVFHLYVRIDSVTLDYPFA